MIRERKESLHLKRMAMCEVAAKIYLYCGGDFSEQNVAKFWNYPSYPPSYANIYANITNKNVRWYIHEKINSNDPIWNGDFFAGLTLYGKVGVGMKRMPFFDWAYNDGIVEMVKECPYYGRMEENRKAKNYHRWKNVAALCLKANKNSISYIAGVLSAGKECVIDNNTYARYSSKIKNALKEFNIPIEKEYGYSVCISPFWIALLTPWMPESRKKWLNVKNPYKAEEYAFILWRVFTGRDIESDGIPFLPSRRTFYYRYHTIDNLEKKWVDNKLVELDSRFKEVIQKWANNELSKVV